MGTQKFEYQGRGFRVYVGDCAELFLDAGDFERIVSVKPGTLEQNSEYFEEWENNVCKTIRAIPEKTFVSCDCTSGAKFAERYLSFLQFFYSEIAPKVRMSFGYSYNRAAFDDIGHLSERLKKSQEEYRILLGFFVKLSAQFGTLCRETGRNINGELGL